MRLFVALFCFIFLFSCSNKSTQRSTSKASSIPLTGEAAEIAENADHPSTRMQYKLIASKFTDKEKVWATVKDDLEDFTRADYDKLKPLIYEQDITNMQRSVSKGLLTYKLITQWYLYRIILLENDPTMTLHAIIALNEDAVEEAEKCDKTRKRGQHPIFGMPILLKDNIGATGMATTAGAIVMANNYAPDATIVKNMKAKGAIILGKANLSEWAYYFCDGCPLGYSAVGGQSLNPYGRRVFETGGSSAGSATTMAANYAAGAVGTETAGSILSPSSQNSIVGLKPTLGLLSRTGIIPISSTLDTPGPMTRSVKDNAILLSAMVGKDPADPATRRAPDNINLTGKLTERPLAGLRLGANKNYLSSEPLYKNAVEKLKEKGVIIIEYTPREIKLDGFISILDYDMKRDLPLYLQSQSPRSISVKSVADVITFNKENMEMRAPYGQARFEGSRDNSTSDEEMKEIKKQLIKNCRNYFDDEITKHNLDGILSINNYDAATAALAKFPCLALPMGYTTEGEPKALTLIGRPFTEDILLQIGYTISDVMNVRKTAKIYE